MGRFQGLGFRSHGSGFWVKVQGLGFRQSSIPGPLPLGLPKDPGLVLDLALSIDYYP